MTDRSSREAGDVQTALTRRSVCQACGASVLSVAEVTPVRCHVCRRGVFVTAPIPPAQKGAAHD